MEWNWYFLDFNISQPYHLYFHFLDDYFWDAYYLGLHSYSSLKLRQRNKLTDRLDRQTHSDTLALTWVHGLYIQYIYNVCKVWV